jgi:hypothetical protein
VAVLLLQDVQLLDATIGVVTNVVPRVSFVVFVRVGPAVGRFTMIASVCGSEGSLGAHLHLSIRPNVGKGIEDMRHLVCRNVLWLHVGAIDPPE